MLAPLSPALPRSGCINRAARRSSGGESCEGSGGEQEQACRRQPEAQDWTAQRRDQDPEKGSTAPVMAVTMMMMMMMMMMIAMTVTVMMTMTMMMMTTR
eukprot:1255030-Rhodomonas_salina.1